MQSRDKPAQELFYLLLEGKKDLMDLREKIVDEQGQAFLSQLLAKKVNPKRAKEGLSIAIKRILDRNWMEKWLLL